MSEYQALRDHDGNSRDSGPDDEVHGAAGADWRANVADLGKKLGESMGVVGGKLSEQVGVVGDRMKELFHTPTLGERLVDEATSDVLIGPDWSKNLQICDLVNSGRVPGADVVRGVKKRLGLRNGHVQLLALALLEMALKNCASLFSEVAAEKLLDVMVRMVDDPTSPAALREKCLLLIEAWGEATEELRYLPVFEETYKVSACPGAVHWVTAKLSICRAKQGRSGWMAGLMANGLELDWGGGRENCACPAFPAPTHPLPAEPESTGHRVPSPGCREPGAHLHSATDSASGAWRRGCGRGWRRAAILQPHSAHRPGADRRVCVGGGACSGICAGACRSAGLQGDPERGPQQHRAALHSAHIRTSRRGGQGTAAAPGPCIFNALGAPRPLLSQGRCVPAGLCSGPLNGSSWCCVARTRWH